MVNDIMADKKNLDGTKAFEQSGNSPELWRPKRRPPRDDDEVRPVPGEPSIYLPPCIRVKEVKEIFDVCFLQRTFAGVSVSFAGEQPSWVLSFEGIERNLVCAAKMAIE
jgi:hypothetical protein